MQAFAAVPILLMAALVSASSTTPISKVLDLLAGLETKIGQEKAAAIKSFNEFSEWCEDQAKTFEYEINTGKGEAEKLKASIEEQAATASALTTQIDELSSSLAADEADVKAATEIRSKEAADFAAEEKELSEVIDTLDRAVSVLQRELSKGKSGSALLQGKFSTATQALAAIIEASVLSAADASKLNSLLQTTQDSADDSLELGAPAAAVYESHSNNIVETLEGLSDKAQTQLSEARKVETTALHNFELLKQGLEDQIKFNTKDTTEAKKSLAESSEKKAAAESDLAMTSKELEADTTGLGDLNQDCMAKAQAQEAADKARAEELEAIAAAKKAVSEMTGGAEVGTYSLLQVSRSSLSSRADLVNFEAVRFVRDLARKSGGDTALAQLASRMASAMHAERVGEDPFSKVKGLISDMIGRLEEAAGADATQKAYCDKENSASEAKKAEHNAGIEKLTTKIDQLSARSKQLKEQVAELSKSLTDLATSRAEMTKLRQEERAAYVTNKADLEQGIEGVKLALQALRDYYAKKDATSAQGAGTTIIGLLEVCESDFIKGLDETVATEEQAARIYKQEEKENAIEKVTKEKDVEYKTKEAAKLDKALSEATTDRATMQTELDAVMEYLKKLEDMCVAKPETYAARKAHRESEIAGLKEALKILEGESVALLQKDEHRTLRGSRGVRPHVA
jgi:chromosome segregation ATPase